MTERGREGEFVVSRGDVVHSDESFFVTSPDLTIIELIDDCGAVNWKRRGEGGDESERLLVNESREDEGGGQREEEKTRGEGEEGLDVDRHGGG